MANARVKRKVFFMGEIVFIFCVLFIVHSSQFTDHSSRFTVHGSQQELMPGVGFLLSTVHSPRLTVHVYQPSLKLWLLMQFMALCFCLPPSVFRLLSSVFSPRLPSSAFSLPSSAFRPLPSVLSLIIPDDFSSNHAFCSFNSQ
jgi:hypothetical protein